MMRSREWRLGPFARLRGRAFVVVACLAMAGVLSPGAMAQEVMSVAQNMPGFKAGSVYENFGNGESVNPFNGGLTVAHPSSISLPQNMGGVLRPTRYYNSKDIKDGYIATGNVPSGDVIDKPYGFMGEGWLLSYGRVFVRLGERITKPDVINDYLLSYACPVFCYYQDDSGAERQLYWGGGVDIWQTPTYRPAGGWYFTNDASYIRAYYDSGANKWTLFYPDGSKRVAGGTNAYIEQQALRITQNPDGSYYPDGWLTNPTANGWYVTSLLDRSGNSSAVSYRPYDPVSQPYAGSIEKITDQFGREITFNVYQSGDFAGLLESITCGSKTETYTYATYELGIPPAGQPPIYRPFLVSVLDAGSLETRYDYTAYAAPGGTSGEIGGSSTLLTKILYPAGAISEYTFEPYSYLVIKAPLNPEQAEFDEESRGMCVAQSCGSLPARPGRLRE